MSIPNKCKLFQDVDDTLLGTIDLSITMEVFFFFCLGELTWFSGKTEWDQSSPKEQQSIKVGYGKMTPSKQREGEGEGGEGRREES